MAKSIPCVWFRHITATSFGSRSSRGQVDSQDGYRCEESIGREIFREDMGSPGGYPERNVRRRCNCRSILDGSDLVVEENVRLELF